MSTEPSAWVVPSDAAIRAILVERIDVWRRGVGMVVGVIEASGRRVVGHGEMGIGDGRAPGGDTLFEIGSITKAFTSLLLAEMAARGEVAIDDPVSKHLPAGVAMPARGGRHITLIDLATHTSGLPRMDTGGARYESAQILGEYTVDQLYRFLSDYRLTRDIGERFEYSNLGAGLLGHVLALRAGVDFETLVRQRVTDPLGMTSTTIAVSPAHAARLATGHDLGRKPVTGFYVPALAGAGALRSTANDMLTFLAAELGHRETPLAAAMAAQIAPRRPGPSQGIETALGWRIRTTPTGEVVCHGGGTPGQLSYLGFDRPRGVGVVVLTNCAASNDRDNIGRHLLFGEQLWSDRPSIELSSDVLERYVGRYALTPRTGLAITRDGGRLFAQRLIEGLKRPRPILETFPVSKTCFFWKVVSSEITFEMGSDGSVTALELRQESGVTRGRRVFKP